MRTRFILIAAAVIVAIGLGVGLGSGSGSAAGPGTGVSQATQLASLQTGCQQWLDGTPAQPRTAQLHRHDAVRLDGCLDECTRREQPWRLDGARAHDGPPGATRHLTAAQDPHKAPHHTNPMCLTSIAQRSSYFRILAGQKQDLYASMIGIEPITCRFAAGR
jgi:hypothetical protein